MKQGIALLNELLFSGVEIVASKFFACLAIFSICVLATGCTDEKQPAFDPEKWRANGDCTVQKPPIRLRMVDALEAIFIAQSPSKKQTLSVLGEPDSIRATDQNGEQLSYCVGVQLVDYYSYVIIFDEEGKFVEGYLSQG